MDCDLLTLVLGVVSVLLGVFGIIQTNRIHTLQRKHMKRKVFAVYYDGRMIDTRVLPIDAKIDIDGKDYDSIAYYEVIIGNKGNTSIANKDLYTPPKISFGRETKVIAMKVLKREESSSIVLREGDEMGDVTIVFDNVRKHEALKCGILVDGGGTIPKVRLEAEFVAGSYESEIVAASKEDVQRERYEERFSPNSPLAEFMGSILLFVGLAVVSFPIWGFNYIRLWYHAILQYELKITLQSSEVLSFAMTIITFIVIGVLGIYMIRTAIRRSREKQKYERPAQLSYTGFAEDYDFSDMRDLTIFDIHKNEK